MPDAFEFRWHEDAVAARIAHDVEDIMGPFERAGIVRRIDAVELSSGRRRGGSVGLTPAGVVSVQQVLGAVGFQAPVAIAGEIPSVG